MEVEEDYNPGLQHCCKCRSRAADKSCSQTSRLSQKKPRRISAGYLVDSVTPLVHTEGPEQGLELGLEVELCCCRVLVFGVEEEARHPPLPAGGNVEQ